MPDALSFDPKDLVAGGLSVAVTVSGDASLAVGGTRIYESVRAAIAPELGPADHVTIVVPCVRIADRLGAILVVLQDRAILAWVSGIYRKKRHVEVMPLSSSWGATIAPGSGARRAIRILTIQWAEGPPWVIAVPSDAATTRFLRECFIARS
jgi:hypothetical protein